MNDSKGLSVNEETKIFDFSKKYKYRCGHEPDAVFYDRAGMLRSVHGAHAFYHHNDGSVRYPSVKEGLISERDLIEISLYEDWEIDAPALFWNENKDDAKKRHFAGVSKNGKPLAYTNGTTSFTNVAKYPGEWQHAELWEGDDD